QARDEQAGHVVACPACGRRLTVPDTGAAVRPAAAGVRQGPGAPAAEGAAAPAAGPAVTTGKATASLVLGVLALRALLLAGLSCALFGFLALNDMKKGRGRVRGKGVAVTGLVLGLVNTLATCACVPLVVFLWPVARSATEAPARAKSVNNLKQI